MKQVGIFVLCVNFCISLYILEGLDLKPLLLISPHSKIQIQVSMMSNIDEFPR